MSAIFAEVPLHDAETVTVCLRRTDSALALKVAVLEFALTVSEAGMESNAGLAVRVTGIPPEGAAEDSVTVQDVLAPETTVVGEQESLDTVTGDPISGKVVVLDAKFRVAVMAADWFVNRVPVVALNCAEVAAPPTVTEAGTVRLPLLLTRLTGAPPPGAAWVNVTVQVLLAFEPRLDGVHAREETSTGGTRLIAAVPELPL